MDYIVLSITAGIMRATISAKTGAGESIGDRLVFYLRKILAAFLGAVWVCIMLALRLRNPLWNAVTYLVVCGLMVYTVAGKNRPGVIIKGMGIMYLTTSALGGFIHILYYYTAFGFFVNSLGKGGGSASLWLVLGSSVIAAPAVKLFFEFAAGRLSNAGARSIAVICNKDKEIRLDALCDTGNSLTDPLYGEPVNVVEAGCVQELVGAYEECSYHLIPYSSIGNDKGLIPVVRLDRLTVIGTKGTFIIDRPLFALYSGKFAAQTDYKVIIHPMAMSKAQPVKKVSGTKG